MKSAAVTGAAVAIGTDVADVEAQETPDDSSASQGRCPFFDQPLMCKGKEESGKYPCE
jgi:hypothetical protein